MPTLVRNTEKGPTVFADPPNNIAIEWAGVGDSEGGDVQHVPDVLITENTSFLKAIQNGIFEVVEATPEVEAKLAMQVKAYREGRDKIAQVGEQAMDRTAERPLTTVTIDEKGKVEEVQEPQAQRTEVAQQGGEVITETEEYDEDGKPIEGTLPVIIEPRQS